MDRYPDDRLYYREHEWVKPLGDGTALIGISWYAQDSLGDIVYVSVPDAGEEITVNEEVGEIESVKAVSSIYSPVSGTVVEVNSAVIASPEIINRDPYEEGWIFKVELTDEDELNDLMSAAQYRKFVEEG
jgi:glycine cleavage system H protein